MTKPRTPTGEARQQLGRLLDALAKEALEMANVDEMKQAVADAIAKGSATTADQKRGTSHSASEEASLRERVIAAARNELDMMSDSEVDGLLEELRALGVIDASAL